MVSTPKIFVFAVLCIFVADFTAPAARAAEKDELDYPELQVVPRASERIQLEAKREAGDEWRTQLPLATSALLTFTAGIIQIGGKDPGKDTDGFSPLAGILVGGGWLATSWWLGRFDRPYAAALPDINALPKNSAREKLVRERMSEEAINSAASKGRRLTWLSVITHVGAGGYMLMKSESGSLAMITDLTAMAGAFIPVIFPYRWGSVASEQRDYKKKIFGPIAGGATFFKEPRTGALMPGLMLGFRF